MDKVCILYIKRLHNFGGEIYANNLENQEGVAWYVKIPK